MWRKKIDKSLRPYLEKFITETYFHDKAFKLAEDPSKAQLWVAIALLSKQLYNLEMKTNYLERALKDISQTKDGEKFLQEIEEKVKGSEKEKEPKEPKKVEKEMKALGTGASLLSQIARRSVKKKAKPKKKKK